MTAVQSEKVPALSTEGLTVSFGGAKALNTFTMSVNRGERVGLIGPNGAGKSTFINAVTGNIRATGTVRLGASQLHREGPHRRARMGMVRTFQHLSLFDTMTVEENIRLGSARARSGVEAGGGSIEFDQVIELFGLEPLLKATVKDLAYGTRKVVELGRAMASSPTVLLLDEPVAGLDTSEKARFVAVLDEMISTLQCATILIEHDMPTVEALTHRVYVLSSGTEIAAGSFESVARDPQVISAYLGG